MFFAQYLAGGGSCNVGVNCVMDEPGNFHYIFGAGLRGSENQVIPEERREAVYQLPGEPG